MTRRTFVRWDETYRRGGRTHRSAALSCSRWLVTAQALQLAPQFAHLGYVGCVGGWKDLVSVGSVRPHLCDVVDCFEAHARAFPEAPEDCSECEHFETYAEISGRGLEDMVAGLLPNLFSRYASQLAALTSTLIRVGSLAPDDLSELRDSVEPLCIEELLEALRRRDP